MNAARSMLLLGSVAAAACAAEQSTTVASAPPRVEAADTAGGPGPLGLAEGNVDDGGGTFVGLYFAVVGDTRPPEPDATAEYPTHAINRIYEDIAALSPPPQFVIATGDYMFARNESGEAQKQMALYAAAAARFHTGPIFAAMGNHECATATATNCAHETENMKAFATALLAPIHKDAPYYAVRLASRGDEPLTVNIVVSACNAWDRAQHTWFHDMVSEPATYSIVVRHEPAGDGGPCTDDEDRMLVEHPPSMMIFGHVHTFEHVGNAITVGNGGAPATSSQPFGFATVELLPGTGFRVVQYDAEIDAPVSVFVIKA